MLQACSIQTVEVAGINLRRDGDHIVVEAWMPDGSYVEVIRERAEGPISHCVHAGGILAAQDGTAAVAPPEEVDWRIGRKCKPKYRLHELYGESGEIVATYDSGANGIVDPNGVLFIRMESGRMLLAPADDWVTA